MPVTARLLDREGKFIASIEMKCVAVIVQFKGRYFVAHGDVLRRANGTIEQDYAEQGVYCLSQSHKQ